MSMEPGMPSVTENSDHKQENGAEEYYGVPAAADMDKAVVDIKKAEKENDQVALFAARERYLAAGWKTISQLKDEVVREREGSHTVYSGWGTTIDSLTDELVDFEVNLRTTLGADTR